MMAATVPNWIAKGYAYQPSYGTSPDKVYAVTGWRATQTQVVVTLEGITGERRFSLDDLREIRRRESSRPGAMRLVSPADPRVREAQQEATVRAAVSALKTAMSARLDSSSMSVEELMTTIDGIRMAATKAMADMGDLL